MTDQLNAQVSSVSAV